MINSKSRESKYPIDIYSLGSLEDYLAYYARILTGMGTEETKESY